jgi:hypothetical protein
MTTPADELRTAAATLRKLADDARKFVPEPWTIAREQVIRAANDDIVADRSECRPGDDADLPYIAAMHPGVGAALADWLDAEAVRYDRAASIGEFDASHDRPLAVARRINGGPS